MHELSPARSPQYMQAKTNRFPLNLITQGVILSLYLACDGQALAADDSQVAELKAENERQRKEMEHQRQEIEALKQLLLKSQTHAEANTTATPPAQAAQSTEVATPVAQTEPAQQAEEESAKTLDDVVVRRKTPLEKLKDVPKSVSVVAGTELQKQDTVNFRDIITRVGNVGMGYSNPQAASLTIRGVGWASGVGQLDPSVGMNVDGVAYGTGAIAASTNFVDLESFDVTRGPQGTLGGKNSSIGQITITSRAPTFTPEANASITYGQRNTIRTQAAVGGPVIDGLLAWRGTFYREQADGQERNLDDQKGTFQNRDRTFGRLQLLLTPSDTFTAKLNVEFTPTINENVNFLNFWRATPDYYDTRDASGNPIAVNQALEPTGRLSRRWFAQESNYSVSGNYLADQVNRLNQLPHRYSTKGGALNLSWDVANHTLSSITAYRDYYFDAGSGPNTVFDIDRTRSAGHVEYEQYSQEFKLRSQSGGFVDYQTGVYLYRNYMPERWSQNRYGSDAGAYYATVDQYNRLDADGNGRYLMLNSIDRLFTKTKDVLRNESVAGYGNINFHLSEPLTINAGLRLTSEDRRTSSLRRIEDQGFGAELNPASRNNVQLGGFNSNAKGGLTSNSAEQLALANLVAQKYFKQSSYAKLTDAQKQQVADAKAIRLARLGGLYQNTDAEPFEKVLPTATFSPIYKFNENHTAYFTYQHGEKAGISQVVGATVNGGKSAPAKEEISNSFELGFRSSLFNRSLFVAADVFFTKIDDYLQPMYFEDQAQTLVNNDGKIAYTSGLGNVPEVHTKGVELDLTYSGIEYTTLRFAGAYNDARYEDFKFLAKPLELGGSSIPYYDASGKTLPGAPKFTFNLNANYARPISDSLDFHANVNYRFTSSYNNDPSLSRYAMVDPYGITDVAIGFGRRDRLVDASLIVNNLFDTDYGFNANWNTYVPSLPRWVGFMVSTKL
ncbi:TonB-dependent receptor [Methylococcus sp. EFPC2]|uniref:TonB-dependent receptor n=1 Tax=Methylococcus sp. EFPC2 TaxID=2812648 RepID=UPI001966FE58|nr:TonB-dependent receptor [Methylococcus sp. EFPC2]QSA97386.1 TonB-dependent receptor [Methylococcus sp. EFPC2]